MKYGLSESVTQKICGVFSRYPQVDKVILYGSRAKGNHRNGSDIDLTICNNGDMTLHLLFRILDDLDGLLLPYTIDLSILNDINDPDVLEHIRRVGTPFYVRAQEHAEILETVKKFV